MVTPNTAPSSEAEFIFTFDGDSVSNGSMDVRDFVPAVIALGQAFERANFLLNSDLTSVNLRVVGTRQGSFGIELMLSQFIEADLLNPDNIRTALDLKELLIGGGAPAALIGLLKRLKGRKANRVERQPDNNYVVHIDNLTVNVTPDALHLLEDKFLRDRLKDLVEPLLKDGISRISFGEDGDEIDSVEEDEAVFFQVEPEDGTVNEYVIPRQALTVISPVFGGAGKWRLNDGSKTNWYTISDDRFLHEVQTGRLRFGEDDILICRVKSRQWHDGSRLRSDLEIVTILGLQTVEGEDLIQIDDLDVSQTLGSVREARRELPPRRFILR